MHFIVIVIGPDVEKQLAPHEGEHWDSWQVGGRYSGGLLLKEGAPGELGDRSIPETEKGLMEMFREATGVRVTGPGSRPVVVGTCADIARKGDVRDVPCPFAIVQDGSWTECWDYQTERLMAKVGHEVDQDDPEITARRRRVIAWKMAFDDLIESLSDDVMITLVDCHN